MACFHIPSVTCENCAHLDKGSAKGVWVETTLTGTSYFHQRSGDLRVDAGNGLRVGDGTPLSVIGDIDRQSDALVARALSERDEAVEALESLEDAILELLPYRYDDGTDEEADPDECLGYAAKELAELRKKVAAASALEAVVATSASVEAQLRQERDKARADYQFMVDRAINEKLDGYRELGARAAAAENERDDLRRLLQEAHAELATIEAITVSPSDTDGLIDLCNRIYEAIK